MSYLLFVDDDPNILYVNQNYFTRRGYNVTVCTTSEQALLHIKKNPVDCVILDIVMPETDGFTLCRQFKTSMAAPVIFLTAMTEKEFLYQGFSLGGDDFLTKPYDLRELEIRINTRIRQQNGVTLRNEQFSFPPLLIDVGTRQVLIDNREVFLTAYEFDIFLLLVRSPGHVFSPEAIYREIWKLPDIDNTRTVKVHMARIRHKLEAACPDREFIGTAWKQGYYFEQYGQRALPGNPH